MPTVTDVVAWVGALTGTASLVWDVFKWKTAGPALEISANPNLISLPVQAVKDAMPHLFVRVANRGTSATTIRALVLEYWSSSISRALGRPPETFAVLVPRPNPLPALVEPGAEWTTLADPANVIERARAGGVLVCRIEHSMSRKPTRARVPFPKRPPESAGG
jgi:hypothetical protein